MTTRASHFAVRRGPIAIVVAGLLGWSAVGCGLLSSDHAQRTGVDADAGGDDDAAPGPAVAHMVLQPRTEAPTGIATDPVAERALRRSRPVDASELDALPLGAEFPAASQAEELGDEVAPLAYRVARQILTIRTEPRNRAPLRGRIPMGSAFEVFAFVDGEGEDRGCGGVGWAEIGGGYVCLEQSRKAAGKAPRTLPKMRDRGLAPYYYAKVTKGERAQQWASIAAYRAGEEPVRTLQANHNYAFNARKIHKGELFLVDARRRVVPERSMARFYPSTFEGVDLQTTAIPEGAELAWTVKWPETQAWSEASASAPLAASLGYHEVLYLDPQQEVRGWIRIADGSGYVQASSVRRWRAPKPLATAAAGETWVDVDLEQQTLTVMRGKTPVFATLISSGFKAPTPRGIFRIRLKQATGTMSSNPDAVDTYAVEAVPHVQYFFNSFALHSSYWHNRYGHKMSHGCVNLSPKDAQTVYSVTGPHPRDGWLHAYESVHDLGTTVRIRNGDEEVRDRRGEVEPVFG